MSFAIPHFNGVSSVPFQWRFAPNVTHSNVRGWVIIVAQPLTLSTFYKSMMVFAWIMLRKSQDQQISGESRAVVRALGAEAGVKLVDEAFVVDLFQPVEIPEG
jgi:hypothetical protein